MLKTNSRGENARADEISPKQRRVEDALRALAEFGQPAYPMTREIADEAGLTTKQTGYFIRDAAEMAGVEIERWSRSAPTRWQIHPPDVRADNAAEFARFWVRSVSGNRVGVHLPARDATTDDPAPLCDHHIWNPDSEWDAVDVEVYPGPWAEDMVCQSCVAVANGDPDPRSGSQSQNDYSQLVSDGGQP